MATATPVDLVVDPAPTTPADASTEVVSVAARYLLAALSLGAGAIHFAMVPSHAGQSMVEGLGFALSGWFQVLFAGALLAKPSKLWLKLGIAANLLFVAVWAWSRTKGLPIGAHPNHAETISFIDGLTVGLEASLILFTAIVLVHPRFLADLPRQALAIGSVVPVAALLAATAAIASPSASSHAGDSHGGHGSEVATGAAGDGHTDHDHGTTAAAAGAGGAGASADGHDHAAGGHGVTAVTVKPEDRCDWTFNTQTYWGKNPPAKEDPSHLGSHAEHEESKATAGNGEGNEHGAQAWAPMTDSSECAKLESEVEKMKEVAAKYPTAQDAMNAGCIRVTIYVTGIAAHYACFKNGWDDKTEIDKPEMILFGGSQPWAPIVGLSYMIYTAENPSLDPNQDLWVRSMPFHYHSGLCVKGALVIGGDNSDKTKCEASGGKVMGKTGFMGHYWLDNCNSPDGVFSANNPRLDIGVANVNDDPSNDPKTGATNADKLIADPCKGSTMGNGFSDKFGAPDGLVPAGSPAARTEEASSRLN